MRLAEKVAVITGAGSGIGRASAILFAREGAKIVVADINTEGGEGTAAAIREAGGEAIFVRTDVSAAADVENLASAVLAEYGTVDVLYNNAGIGIPNTPVEDIDEALWDKVYSVNVKGVFLGAKYLAPVMKKAGRGVILNTSSLAALRPPLSGCAYVSSKGAVVTLTKALAAELAPYRVRVNCICPTLTDTPMMKDLPEERRQMVIGTIRLGRIAQPEDMANAALYLASDEAAMVTGMVLTVDGGGAL
ncbi:SDR family oxidoreductase [Chloroflexota bacterium]